VGEEEGEKDSANRSTMPSLAFKQTDDVDTLFDNRWIVTTDSCLPEDSDPYWYSFKRMGGKTSVLLEIYWLTSRQNI